MTAVSSAVIQSIAFHVAEHADITILTPGPMPHFPATLPRFYQLAAQAINFTFAPPQ